MVRVSFLRRLGAGFAGLLIALIGLLVTPAAASADLDKPMPVGKLTNCAVSVETGASRCFRTATEAISFASGGQITDAPSGVNEVVHDPKMTERINDLKVPAVLIGIEYYWTGYNPPALYFYGSSSCSTTINDIDYQRGPLPTLGGINWNNNIRSFIGYNNCWQRLYDFSNCTGTYYGYAGYSSDLGSFRDRANCIRWS
jgi:hypothetical protein